MRKSISFILLVLLAYSPALPLSIDIKTKFLEKSEITSIKVGAIYFLEQKGIQVLNIGEDFAVWLKDIERSYICENQYAHRITVKLSYPTSLIEKRTIKEEILNFRFTLTTPIKEMDERLNSRLKKHFLKVSQRLLHEAYIGGIAVATCIEELLRSAGAVKE